MIPEEYIEAAAKKNQDGFGYAYAYKGHTVIKKSLDWTEMAENYYKDVKKHPKSTFLMHFRWATNGSVSIKNSHPFALRQGGALVHNGVLHIPGMPMEASDSRFLVRNIIDRFPVGWENQIWWCSLLEKYIGSNNKLAMVFDDNAYLIINESAGHWKDGVWYSNYSYMPYNRPVVTTYPTTSYKAYQPTLAMDEETEYPGVVDLEAYMAQMQQDDCCEILTGWCEDCYEDLTPGEDHTCDIPEFVLKQLQDYRKGLEPTTGREIVPYGRVV